MEQLLIKEIAAALGLESRLTAQVDTIMLDSREVKPASLFIAIKGERFDAHDFVPQVLEKGAEAAVCESIPKGVSGEKILLVKDTRKALLDLAAYYRKKFNIPVVGLTGSVGKTTTKEMVAAVLAQRYKTVYTQGNLNNEIGLPKMCFKLDSTTQAAVLEMGMNHFGEILRLSQTAKPTIGLITNIGVSHIENLGSREGILRAKLEILEGMENAAPLILNGDDERLLKAAKELNRKVLLFGTDNNSGFDLWAEDITQQDTSMSFTVCSKEFRQPVTLPAIGMHNVSNALAAFAVGTLLYIPPEQAAAALAAYVPSGMRQRVVKLEGLTVIEDCYNASPDSIEAALSALRDMPVKGRRIAVLGDMLELGSYAEREHLKCGVIARNSGVDLLFAYGENAKYYVEGAGKGTLYNNKSELAASLLAELEQGDAVLFKASRGMKLEDIIKVIYEGWNKK